MLWVVTTFSKSDVVSLFWWEISLLRFTRKNQKPLTKINHQKRSFHFVASGKGSTKFSICLFHEMRFSMPWLAACTFFFFRTIFPLILDKIVERVFEYSPTTSYNRCYKCNSEKCIFLDLFLLVFFDFYAWSGGGKFPIKTGKRHPIWKM